MSLMSRTRLVFLAITTTATLASSCATTATQDSKAAEGAVSAGSPVAKPTTVEEQIALGGKTYGAACSKCHGNAGQGTDKAPPVVGSAALPLDPPPAAKVRKTQFRTAMDVAQFVVTNMPPAPSPKLSEDEYWAVLAFDLSANGVKLQEMVGPSNAAAIVLHP